MTKSERHKFYHSSAWKNKRDEILRRDHYECQECRKRIDLANRNGVCLNAVDRQIRKAYTVHHIKHLDDYPALALDDDNLESVCMICHNVLHGRVLEPRRFSYKEPVTPERWWAWPSDVGDGSTQHTPPHPPPRSCKKRFKRFQKKLGSFLWNYKLIIKTLRPQGIVFLIIYYLFYYLFLHTSQQGCDYIKQKKKN